MVGNKSDLQSKQNACTEKQIEEQAKKLKIPSFKISAKQGEGITEMFQKLIDNVNESLRKQQTLKLVD